MCDFNFIHLFIGSLFTELSVNVLVFIQASIILSCHDEGISLEEQDRTIAALSQDVIVKVNDRKLRIYVECLLQFLFHMKHRVMPSCDPNGLSYFLMKANVNLDI